MVYNTQENWIKCCHWLEILLSLYALHLAHLPHLIFTQLFSLDTFLCCSLQNSSMPQIEISTDRIRFNLNGHTSISAQTFVWFHVFCFDILISDNIKHTLSIQLISFSINCTWWKLPVSGNFDSRSPIAYENNKNKIDTI